MKSILTTQHVHYGVEQKDLIRDISLEIPEGSFVGLVGPNGSGKSTLLKTIYKVNKAKAGTIFLDGEELDHMSNRQMAKKMAVVTQENEISFDFTVMEMMMIGRFAHRSAFATKEKGEEEKCLKALGLVGLEGFAERSFLSLSGGEKQRVLIASAFSRETKFIVLDEPTNHLDMGYQFQIMDLLKKREGVTVFASVHDMNMALTYCDYVIALNHGEIVAKGTPEEVLTEERMETLFRVKTKIRKDEEGKAYIQYMGAV